MNDVSKNSVEVSIIIPCYNAEKYIKKCLDSVFNQTFKNFELICVNDGSTDGTLKILKEYEKNNTNMLVISKKNEGGKNVTKTGLKYVKGKYVCAIDNDDYIDVCYIEKLYNKIIESDSDISICGFQREDYLTKKVFSKEMNNLEGTFMSEENYGLLLEINASLWNKMFKKEIIEELVNYKLDALGLGDMIQLAHIYKNVNKISFTKDILYFYQVREGSNICTMKSDVVDTIYNDLIKIKKDYTETKEEMNEIIDAYAFLHLGISLMYRMGKTEKSNFNEIYRKNKEVLNKYFPLWENNKFYSLKYVIKNKGKNLKILICYFFYKINLFKQFILMYDFITTKFKFDIKW